MSTTLTDAETAELLDLMLGLLPRNKAWVELLEFARDIGSAWTSLSPSNRRLTIIEITKAINDHVPPRGDLPLKFGSMNIKGRKRPILHILTVSMKPFRNSIAMRSHELSRSSIQDAPHAIRPHDPLCGPALSSYQRPFFKNRVALPKPLVAGDLPADLVVRMDTLLIRPLTPSRLADQLARLVSKETGKPLPTKRWNKKELMDTLSIKITLTIAFNQFHLSSSRRGCLLIHKGPKPR
jgi:hypothetical protein